MSQFESLDLTLLDKPLTLYSTPDPSAHSEGPVLEDPQNARLSRNVHYYTEEEKTVG